MYIYEVSYSKYKAQKMADVGIQAVDVDRGGLQMVYVHHSVLRADAWKRAYANDPEMCLIHDMITTPAKVIKEHHLKVNPIIVVHCTNPTR